MDDNFYLANPYTEYITAACVQKKNCAPEDLATWWKSHTHEGVSRIAKDTLYISAMSGNCERVFSSVSRLIGGY